MEMKVRSVMNFRKLLELALWALFLGTLLGECLPVHAATYYFSECGAGSDVAHCVAGDDTRSAAVAQNPATPWKTCAKFTSQFPSFLAGDVVLFAKDGANDACQFYFLKNTNSTGANPIRVGMYTPSWSVIGNKPIINGSTSFTFRLGGSGTATPHWEGLIIEDLKMVGPGVTSTLPAILIGADSDWITLRRLEITQFKGALQCDSGNFNPGTGNGVSEHITLRDSNVHHNRGMGVLSSCDDTTIVYNTFDNNGVVDANRQHQIYLDDSAVNNVAHKAYRFTITGNTLTNNTSYATASAVSPTPGACDSVAIVVHGYKDYVTITRNVLKELTAISKGQCQGISISPGNYSAPYNVEAIRYGNVSDNEITGYALGIGIDICTDCVADNNLITTTWLAGRGIVYPHSDMTAIDADNVAGTHFRARNNTIELKNPAWGSVGIQVSRDGVNHSITSNLVKLASSGSNWSCFNTDGKNSSTVHTDPVYQLPAAAFADFSHNLCWATTGTPNFSSNGGVMMSLSTHEAWLGVGSTGSVILDPQLPVTTVAADLIPPGTSPAIGAGSSTKSSPFASSGKVRTAPPDIGAIQRGASKVSPGILVDPILN
jgi:hypothetical protein